MTNNFKKTNQEDYIQLFSATSMPFLIASFSLEYYKPLLILELYNPQTGWISYLHKDILPKTLAQGFELYGSAVLFDKYVKEFAEYENNATELFKKITNRDELKQADVERFFDIAAMFWKYYQKTEFFYVDKAFEQVEKNKQLAVNLKALESIKTAGREFMNAVIFEKDCYLNRLLALISKQFAIQSEELIWYSYNEIIDIFKDKKVLQVILTERRQSYVFMQTDKFLVLQGAQAENFINKFITDKNSAAIIKGVTANKGKVIGKVRVMLYGPTDFDKINQLIKQMKKGEILVADTTSPRISLACSKAKAIITNQGGLLSHAAVISRELGIPCIVGTKNATKVLKDGDMVEVDADKGIVKILQ